MGTEAPDQLNDDRLTLAGLLLESAAGLRRELDRRIDDDCGLSLQWFGWGAPPGASCA